MKKDIKLIGERIKIARDLRNATLDDIAITIGVAKSTIQRYEVGKIQNPKIPVLSAIANALGVNGEWLAGADVPMTNQNTDIPKNKDILPITVKRFPLYDGIACGKPRLTPDGIECYIEATTDIKADYAVRCHGDSMIGARIHDRDIVFIKDTQDIVNGEIAAVLIGDEATLKRVFFYKEKNLLILKAENSKYEDMVFSGSELQEVQFLGKAIAFQSDIR